MQVDTKDISPRNSLTHWIKDRLKEITELLDSIEINNLSYLSKKKNDNFSNYSIPVVFLRDI